MKAGFYGLISMDSRFRGNDSSRKLVPIVLSRRR